MRDWSCLLMLSVLSASCAADAAEAARADAVEAAIEFEKQVVALCQGGPDDYVLDMPRFKSIESGTTLFDEAGAQRCLDWLEMHNCSSSGSLPQLCHGAYTGTLATSEHCSDDTECSGDAYCSGTCAGDVCGACRDRSAPGEGCELGNPGSCSAAPEKVGGCFEFFPPGNTPRSMCTDS